MITEQDAEIAARAALVSYVNNAAPQDIADAIKLLNKMLSVVVNAIDLVSNGKMEKLQ